MSNETAKSLRLLWAYKVDTLTQVIMMGIIFVGIGFVVGDGQLDPVRLAPILLGYLMWFYARIVIFNSSDGLLSEAETGTLEQLYLSPVRTELLLIGRLLGMLISTSVVVLVIALVLPLILGIDLPMRAEGLPVLALTLGGILGFGLVLGGATLMFKHVASLADLLQNLLLFLTGTMVVVDRFPYWLQTVAWTLPTTQGIIVLRNVVLGNQSLSSAWADGSLVWLALNSAMYLFVGWLLFTWGERVAKRQGTLGQY